MVAANFFHKSALKYILLPDNNCSTPPETSKMSIKFGTCRRRCWAFSREQCLGSIDALSADTPRAEAASARKSITGFVMSEQ